MGQVGGQQTITPEIQAQAQDLHRRRVSAGAGVAPDYRTALAEVAVLASYGLSPLLEDLKLGKRSLQFIVNDEDGNQVRVIQQQRWPMRVWSSRLGVDAYVFTTTHPLFVNIAGWLPAATVEEAPVFWQEENGERVDYAYEIEQGVLIPMPTEFKFTDRCPHGDEYGAIWSYEHDAWECFGCGHLLYNQQDKTRIEHQDRNFCRSGSEGSEGSAGA